MKQPSFWKKPSIYNFLLYPFSVIYSLITCLRNATSKPFSPNIPVICIGNVTSGGAGKTPTAIAIAKILLKMDKKPVFLSRGYGGNLNVTTIVDTNFHTSKQTGDEPLLLSKVATTIVSKNRISGARLAGEKDFDVIIMDDGLQNPTIKKTLSFLVIDGTFGLGSGYIIPSGPLRESLKKALAKTAAVIFIGEDKTNLLPKLTGNTIIKGSIKPSSTKEKGGKYIAFAGLGNPDKFFNTLKESGYNVIEEVSFTDHYQYNDDDIAYLNELGSKNKAKLITTEKDIIRLNKEQKKGIESLPIEIKFEDEKILTDILDMNIKKR